MQVCLCIKNRKSSSCWEEGSVTPLLCAPRMHQPVTAAASCMETTRGLLLQVRGHPRTEPLSSFKLILMCMLLPFKDTLWFQIKVLFLNPSCQQLLLLHGINKNCSNSDRDDWRKNKLRF